ncbi:hypothetical protein LX77_01462 [Gelidibacter algens]|uniref:Uncharacterized protein n=1 Tax=Gelidibacter algens TaxID=49280 RepID=A0A327S8A5_9FLAO|nr:hypothetical protein LX77_01462 [Gelidibacter algens]
MALILENTWRSNSLPNHCLISKISKNKFAKSFIQSYKLKSNIELKDLQI